VVIASSVSVLTLLALTLPPGAQSLKLAGPGLLDT